MEQKSTAHIATFVQCVAHQKIDRYSLIQRSNTLIEQSPSMVVLTANHTKPFGIDHD